MEKENQLATTFLDIAFKVHRALGPGLLESCYEEVLAHELAKSGIPFERQIEVSILYEGISMGPGFRADLVLSESIIIEIKSVEQVLPVHKKQLLTYLRLTGLHLGLLVNFNAALLKEGITRIAN